MDSDGASATFDGRRWHKGQTLNFEVAPYAVSCASSKFCMATGTTDALSYNGSRWGTNPTTIDSQDGELDHISCPSSSFCAAADELHGAVLTYDGSKWSSPQSVDLPPPHRVGPKGLSCPTADFCVMVDGSGNVLTYRNGSWSRPVKLDKSSLESVSCPSAGWCEAVDYKGGIATFSKGKWKLVPNAVSPDVYGSPRRLSCASPAFCGLVGKKGGPGQTNYAAVKTGSRWGAPIRIDHGDWNQGVACPAVGFCVVAGASGNVYSYRAPATAMSRHG